MDKLLPCPCCGWQAAIHRDSSIFCGQHYEKYPNQLHGFRVECEGACHLMTCWWHTKDEATTAWNTRTPKPVDAVSVEAEELAKTLQCVFMARFSKEDEQDALETAIQRIQAALDAARMDAGWKVSNKLHAAADDIRRNKSSGRTGRAVSDHICAELRALDVAAIVEGK